MNEEKSYNALYADKASLPAGDTKGKKIIIVKQ